MTGRPRHERYWKQVTKVNDKLKCKRCGHMFKGGVSRIKAHVDRKQGQGVEICSIDPDTVPNHEEVDHIVAAGSSNPEGVDNAVNSFQEYADKMTSLRNRDSNGVDHIVAAGSSNPEGVDNAVNSLQDVYRIDAAGSSNPHMEEVGHHIIAAGSSNPHIEEFGHIIAAGSSNPHIEEFGHIIAAGSSNPHMEEVVHIIAAGLSNPQGVVNAVNSLQGCMVPAIMGSNNRGTESEISEISSFNHSIDDLTCEEGDVKEQLQLLKSRGKKHKNHVDKWLANAGKLLQSARVMAELTGFSGLEIQDLTEEVQQCKEKRPLVLSEELVGSDFEENIKEVWELLGDDKVFKIGIHGMGGVGKTCLVNHIRYEITRRCAFNFKDVLWVTASQNVSNFGLQNVIAQRIGVELDKYDIRIRAEVLSSELLKKEKCLFILDNVWKYIDIEKVGIPLEVKGNKLILTSRLKHVCRQMDCHIIAMHPLYCPYYGESEGWELFLLKHRFHGTPSTFPPEALKIAKSIVHACEGLPLGIGVMARTMKGVNDIHCWRHTLNRLQNSRMEEEMEEEVFKILKLSYDNLIDDMKKCFLCCALFTGSGAYIRRHGQKELIMNLVEEGLINGMRSLEEIFDEGHTILDKLLDHSLLLDCVGCPEIHGLIREMVCHNILKDRSRYMVKCNKRLEKIPGMQEWTPILEKVSLLENDITKIPADTSPHCPKLSTLILCQNKLNYIPDCFFSHMDALTILDLSYNGSLKRLPNSVANLRSLVSLLLKDCRSLENVPPLGELQKLSRLVISCTSIKEIPQGLERLINLKWLDLSMNSKLIAGFVLPSFGNTQYLDLRSDNVKVKTEDIKGSSMLECFAGYFHDRDNYNDFVRDTLDKDCGPNTYHLLLGIVWDMYDPVVNIKKRNKIVTFGDCEELPHLLPKYLTELNIQSNEKWRCLSHALSFTPRLKRLTIFDCHKMEKLLTPGSLEQLQNLEYLSVQCCDSMKEIFSMRDDDYSSITLPKLTTLLLLKLPQLKSVCRGILKCGSSEVLHISCCPSLRRHPIVEVFSRSYFDFCSDSEESF